MKFSIPFYNHKYFDPNITLEDFFRQSKEEGFDAVDFVFATMEECEAMPRLRDKYGLELACFRETGIGFPGPSPISRGRTILTNHALHSEYEHLAFWVRKAQELGMPFCEVVPNWGAEDIRENRELLDAYTVLLRDLAQLGESHQVTITFQNHSPYDQNNIEGMKFKMELADSPFIKVAFDPGHFVNMGASLDQAIDELKDHIAFVKFKDCKRHPDGSTEFVNPGEGDVNYPHVASRLAEIGYDGYVSFHSEANGCVVDPDKMARDSLTLFRKGLGGGG